MKAMFGSGCFWSRQKIFSSIEGVKDTAVGYSGGVTENPDYRSVCAGNTQHAEVCYLEFDESKILYQELLNTFWQIHDPTTLNQQGPDNGTQYRSVIYYYNQQQKELAEASKAELIKKGVAVVTEISEAQTFWRAEEYHQHYFDKT